MTRTTHSDDGTGTPDVLWGESSAGTDGALPEQCDDLVVGAGIAGLTTALSLARAGRHVCVLEARRPGSGATGRTGGNVSLLHGARLSTIAETHSLDVAARYLEANRRGQDWLGEFCDDHDVPLEPRSAVTTTSAAEHVWRVGREHLVARSLGLPVSWAEGHPRFPSWGATRLGGQFQLDPVRLVDALTRAVRRAGGTVLGGARVRSLSRSGTCVKLADGRQVRARTVTVTSGAPVVGDPLASTRLRAMRSYLLAFRHPDPPEDMVLSIGSPTRSLRSAAGPDGEPVLLVGGEAHPVGRADGSARVDALRRWTASHFPDAREAYAWSAQDLGTTTGLPLVGRAERHREVRYATGFGTCGLTNAPAAAMALVDDILGVHPVRRARHYLRGRAQPARRARANAATGARHLSDVVGLARREDGSPAPGELARGQGLCPHLGGLLQWNSVERTWDCPLHGSRFDRDGQVLEGPATRDAKVLPPPG